MATTRERIIDLEHTFEELEKKVAALQRVPRVARCYLCGQVGFEKEMDERDGYSWPGLFNRPKYAHIACIRKQRGVEVCACCEGKGETVINEDKEKE